MTSTAIASYNVLLTADEIDDLIYYARTGDLDSLKDNVTSLSQLKSCSTTAIIRAAVDVDEEGIGSGSSLLHYPAANGNLEVVEYLLTCARDHEDRQGQEHTSIQASSNGPSATTTNAAGIFPEGDVAYTKFVNHQNVSGNTPLHWAGVNGHLEVVKVLMKATADPGIVNGAGRDAVFESDVSSKEGAAECAVEMLKFYEGLEKNGRDAAASSAGDEAGVDGEIDGSEESAHVENSEQGT